MVPQPVHRSVDVGNDLRVTAVVGRPRPVSQHFSGDAMIKARGYGGVTFSSKPVAYGLDEPIHTAAMLSDHNGWERPGAAGYAGIHIHFLTVYLQFFPERWHFSYLQNLKNDVWVSFTCAHILTFPISWGK